MLNRVTALFPAVLFAALLGHSTAYASVTEVLLFPDGATVTRVHEFELHPDTEQIRIEGLPTRLQLDSIRVRAPGPEGLRIGTLDFERVRGSERVTVEARELEQRLEELTRQRHGVEDRITVRELQLSVLEDAEDAEPEFSDSLAERLAQLDRLGQQADQIFAQRRELMEQKQELSEEIERLQQTLEDMGREQLDSFNLTAAIEVEDSGPARFTVEYTVTGAYWQPVYEWRLDTITSRLGLILSARVRQSTGEDWRDAKLAVSLARPSTGGNLPKLAPWWVDVQQPPRPDAPDVSRQRSLSASERIEFTDSRIVEAKRIQAELTSTGLSQRYEVPGRVTVPSNNRNFRFRLAEHALDATVTARAVPQRNAAAWTFVKARWTGEAALPSGNVRMYQDGTAMGLATFEGIAPGATIEQSFGADDRIEVQTELIRQDRSTSGLISKTTREVREYRWTLTNRHSRSMQITLLGQMPVARDDRIEVELTDRTDPPNRRDIDNIPGRIAWDLEVAAGETREIILGFAVSWPAELPGVTGW